MDINSRIYVAGHSGLVGSAILRTLRKKGYSNIITRDHSELDLTDCDTVAEFFKEEKPEYVFLAAAKVGGIKANNKYRADFLYENLMIQTNVIHQSYLNGVRKLLFLGSTCIYPKESPQPIREEYLLTGPLEYTNEPYAIAKIAGMKMCESYNLQYGTNFISGMPTNLYGPQDNFDLETSHVLPALIRKIFLGKALEENNWQAILNDLNKRPIEGIDGSNERTEILEILEKYGIHLEMPYDLQIEPSVTVEIWGSGKPLRELLWSEDMADACIFLMERVDFDEIVNKIIESKFRTEIRDTHINIGTGEETSIKELAELVKDIIGFKGILFFNKEKADGTMRKLTDPTKLQQLGWKHKISLREGIQRMFQELEGENDLLINAPNPIEEVNSLLK